MARTCHAYYSTGPFNGQGERRRLESSTFRGRVQGCASFVNQRPSLESIVIKNFVKSFVRDEQGQDLIEYAFLAVFIALVVILGLQAVGTAVNNKMSSIASQVSGAS